ncbi:sulfatase-like hydrolase/transferase [Halobacteria archaeon AArc-m2/3/4]|uniref:Sulfatase-like hydrolase/transferase n=1 Tax=Natronoglomus mannanivorans TaxID=2979990 RepID=A0ABT2QJF7_9EURY|nr:sulfatase-like hydrolase/transferase [Halobacteria archaeon AArc-m2/3/4]
MSPSSVRTEPNVIVLLTDQQRWDTLGAYGCPMDITPTLDSLANDGTVLRQAITTQPSCGPFRASFHTGKFATETGVWRNSIPLSSNETTLAHRFKDGGYDVGFIGNWHISGSFDEPVPEERRGGYTDFWAGADVPEFTTHPTEGKLFDSNNDPIRFEGYRADAFTEYAIEAIESLSEPFFLIVSYLEPHNQNDMGSFIPPDGYAERHTNNPYVPPDLQNRPGNWYQELPNYYGIIERLDECISRLIETLNVKNIRDETILTFTSDHGCHFRTRPGEYKCTPHESAVRVPTILSGPGFDSGNDIDEVTSLIDLPPTLLDAAGLEVPSEMHGTSLLPARRGGTIDEDRDAFIQISSSQIGRAIRTDRWKYAIAAPSPTGWRGGNGQQSSERYVERYLYDLFRDPEESVNLAGRSDYRDTRVDLQNRLKEYIQNIEGEDPEIENLENGY